VRLKRRAHAARCLRIISQVGIGRGDGIDFFFGMAPASNKSVFSPAYRLFLRLLREARARAGVTQAQAARQLGRPQSFISKCESGERRIDVVEFLLLCDAYSCDPGEIIEQLRRELGR